MVNTRLQMEESETVLAREYPVTNKAERGGTGW